MLHIDALCHIAVNMSNRSKICPYKMKKIFWTNGAPYEDFEDFCSSLELNSISRDKVFDIRNFEF